MTVFSEILLLRTAIKTAEIIGLSAECADVLGSGFFPQVAYELRHISNNPPLPGMSTETRHADKFRMIADVEAFMRRYGFDIRDKECQQFIDEYFRRDVVSGLPHLSQLPTVTQAVIRSTNFVQRPRRHNSTARLDRSDFTAEFDIQAHSTSPHLRLIQDVVVRQMTPVKHTITGMLDDLDAAMTTSGGPRAKAVKPLQPLVTALFVIEANPASHEDLQVLRPAVLALEGNEQFRRSVVQVSERSRNRLASLQARLVSASSVEQYFTLAHEIHHELPRTRALNFYAGILASQAG